MKNEVDVGIALNQLRSIRTLINLYRNHSLSNPYPIDGTCARIRFELQNLEDFLIIKAVNELGIDYATKLSYNLYLAWELGEKRMISPRLILKEVRKSGSFD